MNRFQSGRTFQRGATAIMACIWMTTAANQLIAQCDCGVEPVCGCETPVCGCEPAGCGCETPPNCAEPVCGCEANACGCEVDCGCESVAMTCDGSCDGASGKPKWSHRFKASTAKMRRGLNRLLGVDSSAASCDDGCDAMMIQELGGGEIYYPAPVTSAPVTSAPVTSAPVTSAPMTSASPRPMPTMVQPSVSMPPPIVRAPQPPRLNVRQRVDTGVIMPTPPRDITSTGGQSMPLRDSTPMIPSRVNAAGSQDAMDLGSDQYNDPFLDDEATFNHPIKVRRTAFRMNRLAN